MHLDTWQLARRSLMVIAVTLILGACGGNGSPTSVMLSVGGSYPTVVTQLPGGTCGTVNVQNNPTVVAHTPGVQTLSLTHVGNVYPGTVDNTGHFTTTPTTVSGGGVSSVLTITGQFSRTGFDATVNVVQTIGSTSCTYMVHWVGTKDGAPNTFP